MKDETQAWLNFADENLDVAELSLSHGHLNACLHNAQQAVEKYLKAAIIEYDLELKRTHSILQLHTLLSENSLPAGLSEEECDLLDAVYMPSRYPSPSVLPDAMPTIQICRTCIDMACRVRDAVSQVLDIPRDEQDR